MKAEELVSLSRKYKMSLSDVHILSQYVETAEDVEKLIGEQDPFEKVLSKYEADINCGKG